MDILPLQHHLRATFKKAHPQMLALFDKALHLALTSHEGQERISGEPFICHPLIVASAAEQQYGDGTLTIAALLHDVVEDCPEVSLADIYDTFGMHIGHIVEGLTKTILTDSQNGFIHFDHYCEKLLLFSFEDIRVLLLKLLDRQHNMATSSVMSQASQCRMALETLLIYIPLLHALPRNEKRIPVLQRRFLQSMMEQLYTHPSAILEGLAAQAYREHEALFAYLHMTPQCFEDIASLLSYLKTAATEEEVAWVLAYVGDVMKEETYFAYNVQRAADNVQRTTYNG